MTSAYENKNGHQSQYEKICEELAQIAGHELKNPLAAFSLQTYLLRQTLATNGNLEELRGLDLIASRSESQIIRMESLLNRLIWLVETQLRPGEKQL